MKFDDDDLIAQGICDSPASRTLTGSIIRYVAAVVTRERERVAAILEAEGRKDLAAKILDDTNDPRVFKFVPPGRK